MNSGKHPNSPYTQPGLTALLDSLKPEQYPAMVRGDCGFGNDQFILELESRNQWYLFKLRQTKGVQKLLQK